MDLSRLIRRLRKYPGLVRKEPIREVVDLLLSTQDFGAQLPNYGDDAAVIPWGEGFLLLAADGILPQLLLNEPYAAGKASVMVTVNDIYSMGGRPIALVNVLACGEETKRRQILEGIKRGCEKLRVPMVGGHLHPDAPDDAPALSVAILGFAKGLLRSHLCRSGDDLILAVDLQGRPGCQSVMSWDANSGKTPEELLHRLELLPLIAEEKLASAAKDISNAGILGTLAIMIENSGQGATVTLESIPRPPDISFPDWVLAFQSFSFIFSVPPAKSRDVISLFQERDLAAAKIGRVTATRQVILQHRSEQEILFDFNREQITGIQYQG
jgi:uncharacterized protein